MTTQAKFGTWFLASVLMAFGATANAGLIAYWDFEEGAGGTTKNQVNGDDDLLIDTTWVTDTAAPGSTSALQFNGTSSVIETAFEGVGGVTARTITAWVKLADVTDEAASQTILAYGGRAGNGQKWHFRINDNGAPRVRGAIRTEAQGGNQTGDTNIADGLWHHIASVFPGGVGSDNLDVLHYVDGVLEGSTGPTDEPINTMIGGTLPRVSLGGRRQDGNSVFDSPLSAFLNGTLDEVRFYDTALSQAEVQALGVPEPSTILLATLGLCGLLAFRWRRTAA